MSSYRYDTLSEGTVVRKAEASTGIFFYPGTLEYYVVLLNNATEKPHMLVLGSLILFCIFIIHTMRQVFNVTESNLTHGNQINKFVYISSLV